MILILQCSEKKRLDPYPLPAHERYIGQMFKLGVEYGWVTGKDIYVLSALHGIIKIDDLVPHYDSVLTKPYGGPWPEGDGYTLGSKLYFQNAPSRLVPLVDPGRGIGDMKSAVVKLIGRAPRNSRLRVRKT